VTKDRDIVCRPLSASDFAPFGDVIGLRTVPDKIINSGQCERHHDLANLDFGDDGQAGISIFNARPRSLPYQCDLLECHPDGTQAFISMTWTSFLVIAAETPTARPMAFLTNPGQGINFHRGIWHGVLTPLTRPGLFLVIDRIGDTANLEERRLDRPWRIVAKS